MITIIDLSNFHRSTICPIQDRYLSVFESTEHSQIYILYFENCHRNLQPKAQHVITLSYFMRSNQSDKRYFADVLFECSSANISANSSRTMRNRSIMVESDSQSKEDHAAIDLKFHIREYSRTIQSSVKALELTHTSQTIYPSAQMSALLLYTEYSRSSFRGR